MNISIHIYVIKNIPNILIHAHTYTCILGHKIGWQYHQGYPVSRLNLARRMAELGGFSVLLTYLRDPEHNWLGVDTLSILSKAFCEV